jgi:hypothetical protein
MKSGATFLSIIIAFAFQSAHVNAQTLCRPIVLPVQTSSVVSPAVYHSRNLAPIVLTSDQAAADFAPQLLPAEPNASLQPIPSGAPITTSLNAPCGCAAAPPLSNRTVFYASPVPPPVTTFRPVAVPRPVVGTFYMGRGIIGQPKLYVDGQPIRNVLRWLTP